MQDILSLDARYGELRSQLIQGKIHSIDFIVDAECLDPKNKNSDKTQKKNATKSSTATDSQ